MLRDVGTTKSGLILGRWWDHRLRTVVISGDENMNMLGKDLEKARQRNEVSSCLKKIVSFYFLFYLQHEWFFFKEPDTEYRYWSFTETQPAHNSRPAKAKMEATDVLTWTGKCFSFTPFQFH